MSSYRLQAQVDVPPESLWELVGNVERHPEWWPRVVNVKCEGLEEGCSYCQVLKSPMGVIETEVSIERLDECHELTLRCLDTGTYAHWLLTAAQDGTFVEVEFGIDPKTFKTRAFDAVAGKRYFRNWLEQSIAALRVAANSERAAA